MNQRHRVAEINLAKTCNIELLPELSGREKTFRSKPQPLPDS